MLRGLLTDLAYRWRAVVRRSAAERELDDELRFHLEREAEKNRRAGMSPNEAARQARLALGVLTPRRRIPRAGDIAGARPPASRPSVAARDPSTAR